MGPSIVNQGKTNELLTVAATAAGNSRQVFILDAETIQATLFVSSVVGTLDVVVNTFTNTGKIYASIVFPQVTAASTSLLLRKAGAAMSNCEVVATYTGACSFEVYAKGVGSGESSEEINSKLPPNTVAISTLSIITANSDTALVLAAGVKRFSIKSRIGKDLKLGTALGAIVGGTYYTIDKGNENEEIGIYLLSSLTLYIQCATIGVVEIKTWS